MSRSSCDLHVNDPNYCLNKVRTNFTYAESLSYRSESERKTCDEPYLMRASLHKYPTELNYVPTNNKVMPSPASTPRYPRKSVSIESDRILRSSIYKPSTSNTSFVQEYDRDYDNEISANSYVYGALNTNTNNSGPDLPENEGMTPNTSYNYEISGDEGVGSDAFDSDAKDMFGSNNANAKIPLIQKKSKWLQKNMFGLPREDSDETINPDLSGTISGDEQYYMDPHPKSNLYRNKGSRSQYRKSPRNNSYVTNRRFNNIVCSPSALLISIIDWIYQLIILVMRPITSRIRLAKRNSQVIRWLLIPVYLPWSLIEISATSFIYLTNRFFGTSIGGQRNSQHHSRKSSTSTLFYKILLLLTFLTLIFILWHFSTQDNHELINAESSHRLNLNLFHYASQVVGHDCMTKNNCCHNLWEVTRRFSSCLFYLPVPMILSKKNSSSNDNFEEPSKLLKSNISSSEEILEHIKLRFDKQDKKLSDYELRIESHLSKSSSHQSSDKTINEMKKTIESASEKISYLQSELTQLKTNVETTKENLTEHVTESVKSLSSQLEHVNRKLKEDIKSLSGLINETEQHSTSNSEIAKKLENQLTILNVDMDNFKTKLSEVDSKTISLAEGNKKLIFDSANLKKEILDEVNEEIRKSKLYRDDMIVKLNEEMSQMEYKINKDSSKLSNKEYIDNLIIHHFSIIKTQMADINSTLWNNVENHVRTLLQSNEIKTAPNTYTSNYRYSRCPSICVRAHKVRRLLKDALNLFAADKIGIADYALESAGGTIATVRCTETYTDRASILTLFGIPVLRLTNSPRTIIQPNVNPGECWPMKGSKGSVVVQLSTKVFVTAVSIDHIPKSLSPSESTDSAPKEFEIKAIQNETDFNGNSMGNFTYLSDSDPVQTFYIENPIETKFVELIINSNYGNREYTCLYRFRVHGRLF